MKLLSPITTQFGYRCRKAALLLLALALAAFCALFTPSNAQAVPMVKNQPFPYAVGVAMDTALYGSLKTKLLAADRLRKAAESRIASLQEEIKATRKAMDDQVRLGQHDAGKAAGLMATMNLLQGELGTAQVDLTLARRTISGILDTLPRRLRKILSNATPDQVATAVTDYVHTLQRRKWSWSGVAGGAGFVLGIATILL